MTMRFPPRKEHYASSKDERLSPILAKTNLCCGTLKDCTKELKNAFFACLEGYNKLFVRDLTEEQKEWSDMLFSAVKFIGSTNSLEKKQDFLNRKADILLEILNKIG